MKKLTILAVILLLFAWPLFATTYYVSTTGNDDDPGTLAEPWQTLAYAVSQISSGDTVYLRAGTWGERLDITSKSYASRTTFARYPSDPVGSAIIDGTDITPFEFEDGVIWVKLSKNVCIDGLKVINGNHTGIVLWGPSGSEHNLEVLNCITDTTARAGIITFYVDGATIQYNTIYNSNMPNGGDEVLSIASSSTNVDVSYNELYAGDRTLGATGGEGLNIKDGCSYINVHHNLVDMARPDEQESDRYSMGVDGWDTETHHIYFYNNIVKNGSWGIQYNSEEGGYTHHIYAWNNIISHIGHGTMHGGGIGFPAYGGSPGICDYCYWWNNTIYDCYYGFNGNKEELGTGENYVQNNIIYNSDQADLYFPASDEGDVTCDHNLLSTDPKFIDAVSEDFHLQADSPAIEAGATLADVTDDYDGIARPQGDDYDIGAYEYEGDTPHNMILKEGVTVIIGPGGVVIIKEPMAELIAMFSRLTTIGGLT